MYAVVLGNDDIGLLKSVTDGDRSTKSIATAYSTLLMKSGLHLAWEAWANGGEFTDIGIIVPNDKEQRHLIVSADHGSILAALRAMTGDTEGDIEIAYEEAIEMSLPVVPVRLQPVLPRNAIGMAVDMFWDGWTAVRLPDHSLIVFDNDHMAPDIAAYALSSAIATAMDAGASQLILTGEREGMERYARHLARASSVIPVVPPELSLSVITDSSPKTDAWLRALIDSSLEALPRNIAFNRLQ